MKVNERQKMCATCDGRIPVDANRCPYCAAEQTQVYLQHKSIQDSLTSLYPPPYAAKNPPQQKEAMSKTTYTQESMLDKPFLHINSSTRPSHEESTEKTKEEIASFWPILLLSIAANLFVVGLLQLFFSDQGLLTLQWQSRYWFIYCAAALPLFYFGFRRLRPNT